MASDFSSLAGARERLEQAETALRTHDPATFKMIGHWLDKELFNHIYGLGSGTGVPVDDNASRLIVALMQCRIDDYRAIRHGFIRPRPPFDSAQEDIYEWQAQYLEAMVAYVGDGSAPPPYKHVDEFEPDWSPDTSGR